MRICIFGDAGSIHVQRWCGYFSDKGHDVHLVDFLGKDGKNEGAITNKARFHGIPTDFGDNGMVGRLKAKATGNKQKLEQYEAIVKEIVDEIEPDIVHGHYIAKHGYWAARSGFRPLVLTAWGSDIANTYYTEGQWDMVRFAVTAADIVHTGDRHGKARLVELGAVEKDVLVQPWGVEVERFAPSARSVELRNEILGKPDGIIVTLVYALEEQYFIHELIKAASVLARADANVKFQIIGEGKERASLEDLIRQKGLDNVVSLRGRVPNSEMQKYLASSDIYVDTFHSKIGGGGIGVAVMEAMACGLPIVAARRPGIEAGVLEGKNGFLYTHGKPQEMADRIMKIIDGTGMLRVFGRKSRDIALEIGDWNRNMAEFEALYTKLCQVKH